MKSYKDEGSDNIQHKLHIIISHNSKKKRGYFSANACDKWGRCEVTKEDGTNNSLELNAISSDASNCSSYDCNYREIVEIKLSNDFLKDSSNRDSAISLISRNKTHKIMLSKAYLMGYLKAVQ